MKSPWLNLAAEMSRMVNWWQDQDDHLNSARSSLNPQDRDAAQESKENDLINSRREKTVREMVKKALFPES